MVIFIAGATHTGKTLLAQRILERYHYPYLSMDHLKMGLIRSGNTELTVFDDEKLTALLWPIVREMAKTAIENGQNLVVEGCYIPFDWQADFDAAYLPQIRCRWLVMTRGYLETHFGAVKAHANAIEQRLDDSGLDVAALIRENEDILEQCQKHSCDYCLIDKDYDVKAEDFLAG